MDRDDAVRILDDSTRIRITVAVRHGRYGFVTDGSVMHLTRDTARSAAQALLTTILDRLFTKLDAAEPPP